MLQVEIWKELRREWNTIKYCIMKEYSFKTFKTATPIHQHSSIWRRERHRCIQLGVLHFQSTFAGNHQKKSWLQNRTETNTGEYWQSTGSKVQLCFCLVPDDSVSSVNVCATLSREQRTHNPSPHWSDENEERLSLSSESVRLMGFPGVDELLACFNFVCGNL